MKLKILIIGIIICFANITKVLSDTLTFDLFQLETTKIKQLYPDISFSCNIQKQNSENNHSSLSYYFRPQYYYLKRNIDKDLEISVNTNLYKNNYKNKDKLTYYENIYNNDNIDYSNSFSTKNYFYNLFNNKKLHFFIVFANAISYERTTRKSEYYYFNDTTTHTYERTERNFENWNRLAVGIGLGRIYDVTSIIEIEQIIETLNNLNYLSRSLNLYEYIVLIKIAQKKNEYKRKYVNYKKYLISDIENKLIEFNVLKNAPLNSYIATLLLEKLTYNYQIRQTGYRIDYGFGLNYYYNKYRYNNINRYYSPWNTDLSTDGQSLKRDKIMPINYFEIQYAKPLSLKTQFNYQTIIFYPFSDILQNYDFLTQINYTYQLKDNILFSAGYIFNKSKFKDLMFENYGYQFDNKDYYKHKVNINFNYYIEDKINLYLRMSYEINKQNYMIQNVYPDLPKTKVFDLSFGIKYYVF